MNSHYRARSFIFVLACTSIDAHANQDCNRNYDWLQPPGDSIKILVDFEQGEYQGMGNNSATEHNRVFPAPLPSAHLAALTSPKFTSDKVNYVSYYEPDLRNGYRLCRIDLWWPPSTHSSTRTDASRAATARHAGENSVLKTISANGVAISAKMFFYDSKGRFERISEASFDAPNATPVDLLCRRYDSHDRVLMAVSPGVTKICPAGQPDIRDTWRRFEYDKFTGKKIPEITQQHHLGDKDGSWREEWSPFQIGTGPNAPSGHANVNSQKGVYEIYGSSMGKRDDNVANTVLDPFGHWNGSTYTFPLPPVSINVLTDIDALYKLLRRRQTYVEGSVTRLYELFKPNEHLSQHRYYMIGGYVARHEQLDDKGKVVRLITVEKWRQPRPGSKPAVDDNRLDTHHWPLIAHDVFHRVYDIDASGKPTLKALSWNRKWQIFGKGKTSIDFADLVYGTPDGRERWTKAEFEKLFNTSSRASHVFPEEKDRK